MDCDQSIIDHHWTATLPRMSANIISNLTVSCIDELNPILASKTILVKLFFNTFYIMRAATQLLLIFTWVTKYA